MTSEGIVSSVLKSDKRSLFPLFAFSWLTLALFEFTTPLGSVSVATENKDMPVYVGLVMTFIWLVMLYKPPAAKRDRRVTLSHVTRNLVDRIKGTISHKGHSDWMLFSDATKLKTDHHDLEEARKNETLNGLQIDLATSVGALERSVLDDGSSVIRRSE